MTKKELAIRLAGEIGITTPLAEECVEGMMKVMSDAFRDGRNISLRGFGTFLVVNRKARPVRDFRKGTSINLPASRSVKFKVYNGLKNHINGKEAR